MADDKRTIQCNFIHGTSVIADGARCYINYTVGDDRINCLARSRGGRFVTIWLPHSNLTNWRVTTVPPEHPLYDRITDYGHDAERVVAQIVAAWGLK